MKPYPRPVLLVMLLLYLVAGLFRFADLQSPGTLVEREFRSSLFARALYFDMKPPEAGWRVQVARTSSQREGRLEPPVNEFLVATVYYLTGAERPWISRVFGAMFWLAGGLFVFAIACRVVKPAVALVPLGFYLLAPLGVITSRSFQPDSLMILLLLASLHAMLQHAEKATGGRFAWLVLCGAAAILVKPMIAIMVLFAFMALTLHRKGWRGLFSGESVAFGMLCMLPTLLWYSWGAFVATDFDPGLRSAATSGTPGSMIARHFQAGMFSMHLLRPGFWVDWAQLALSMVGYLMLPAGFLGTFLLERSPTRVLLLGAWASYPLFGIIFSGRIADHGYYHLQLVPLVALGIAPLAQRCWRFLDSLQARPAIAAAIVFAWVGFSAYQVRANLAVARFESPDLCRTIGDAVGHSTRAIYVSRNYGRPLEYYGELSGFPWPRAVPEDSPPGTAPMSVEERIGLFTFQPEYFIVTDFWRFGYYHDDLKQWLTSNCRVLAAEETYHIWTDCRAGSETPEAEEK